MQELYQKWWVLGLAHQPWPALEVLTYLLRLGAGLATRSRKAVREEGGCIAKLLPLHLHLPPSPMHKPVAGSRQMSHLHSASSSHQPTIYTHTGCGHLTHFLSCLFIGLDAHQSFEGGVVVPK